MNSNVKQASPLENELLNLPDYVSPEVRVMSEAEVLSAFQVTAAGTTMWWTC